MINFAPSDDETRFVYANNKKQTQCNVTNRDCSIHRQMFIQFMDNMIRGLVSKMVTKKKYKTNTYLKKKIKHKLIKICQKKKEMIRATVLSLLLFSLFF